MQDKFTELTQLALREGAYKAAVIAASEIKTDAAFREMCAVNACGNYGKCWTCPPDVGDINVLMDKIKQFDYALVYQTVGEIEDSYDFEGMMEIAARHNRLTERMTDLLKQENFTRFLHLGAGGCHVCRVCAKKENKPCRYPERAISSLEAYGVNVSELAGLSGMKYINGQDTVTYFSAAFFVL